MVYLTCYYKKSLGGGESGQLWKVLAQQYPIVPIIATIDSEMAQLVTMVCLLSPLFQNCLKIRHFPQLLVTDRER